MARSGMTIFGQLEQRHGSPTSVEDPNPGAEEINPKLPRPNLAGDGEARY